MLRVSEVELSNGAATLKLEGEVIGSGVEEVRQVVEKSFAAGFRLTLDLAELEGQAVLRGIGQSEVLSRNGSCPRIH